MIPVPGAWVASDCNGIIKNDNTACICCGYAGFTFDNSTVHINLSSLKSDGTARIMIVTTVHCPKCGQQYQSRLVTMCRSTVDNQGDKEFAVYDAEMLLRGL